MAYQQQQREVHGPQQAVIQHVQGRITHQVFIYYRLPVPQIACPQRLLLTGLPYIYVTDQENSM